LVDGAVSVDAPLAVAAIYRAGGAGKDIYAEYLRVSSRGHKLDEEKPWENAEERAP
jgi:hypothetical protein